MSKRIFLTKLRLGDAFVFSPEGAVYVRCRGGYRPGRGGPLVKIDPDQTVIRFSL